MFAIQQIPDHSSGRIVQHMAKVCARKPDSGDGNVEVRRTELCRTETELQTQKWMNVCAWERVEVQSETIFCVVVSRSLPSACFIMRSC